MPLGHHVPRRVQFEDGYRGAVQGAQNTRPHLVLKTQLPRGGVINETRVGVGIIACLELIIGTQHQSQPGIGVGRLLRRGHQQDVGGQRERDVRVHHQREDRIPGRGDKRVRARNVLRQRGERVNRRIADPAGHMDGRGVGGMKILAQETGIEHVAADGDLGRLGGAQDHVFHVPRDVDCHWIRVVEFGRRGGVIADAERAKAAGRWKWVPLPGPTVGHRKRPDMHIEQIIGILVALKIPSVQRREAQVAAGRRK